MGCDMGTRKSKLSKKLQKDIGTDNEAIHKSEESCKRVYKGASYHGKSAKGRKNPAPTNGQKVLDSSVQVKPTRPRRIGVDPENGEIVVFDQTIGNEYHGHTRNWDELRSEMQNTLKDHGLVDKKGTIIVSGAQ